MDGNPALDGALSHVRVLDLSRILAGPWCTQNLGDLGAEVIKVERPRVGDDTRHWGPPWQTDADGRNTRDSLYYTATNRNKRSITIDISVAEGQALVRELAAHCDVFVENYKVGDLKRYGLDYEAMRAVNPRLVYCSITGFGQTGPYSGKAGYDFVFQGMGGIMSITGERDDRPGGGPQKAGIALSDVMTGMYATIAILAALQYRERSGQGQYIDMALLDATVAAGGNQAVSYLGTGVPPRRYGNAHASVVPYQVFTTKDGYAVVAVANDLQFKRFCAAIGRPDIAVDPRFITPEGRIRNRVELIAPLEETVATLSNEELISRLDAEQIPCGPINHYGQVFDDVQVKHREIRQSIRNAAGGTTPLVASPLRLATTPPSYRYPPPALGGDTHTILRELAGKTDEELRSLADRGVI